MDPVLLKDMMFGDMDINYFEKVMIMMTNDDDDDDDSLNLPQVQTEITPYMRMMVIDWMFDVSQDLQCRGHEDVFLLSCNVMDSFLSRVDITRTSFQVASCDHHCYEDDLSSWCPRPRCSCPPSWWTRCRWRWRPW